MKAFCNPYIRPCTDPESVTMLGQIHGVVTVLARVSAVFNTLEDVLQSCVAPSYSHR